MVHYWLGEQGYGPFLARLRNEGRLRHEVRDTQGAVRAADRQQPDHRADPWHLLGARHHLKLAPP
jgi:hypothetical protein